MKATENTNLPKIRIHADKREAPKGDLFGIFFEDINYSADGGIYPEMLQNGSFEFAENDTRERDFSPFSFWKPIEIGGAKVELSPRQGETLFPRNPGSAYVEIREPGKRAGLQNIGFDTGISLVKGERYVFSMYMKGDADFPVEVSLDSEKGELYVSATFQAGEEWKRYDVVFTAPVTDSSARLSICGSQKGAFSLDVVSLKPEKTFCGHGLREDLCRKLLELKPRFMRFPGGCLIHGGNLDPDSRGSMYRWKNTLGPWENRPLRCPGSGHYHQSLGLGYYEYFQLCEDIGAEPLPVLPAAYNPHTREAAPLEELQPWIDDALDLIEFANGDVSTKWGAIRAELGHPEPFNMKYLGIGNEEVGDPFFERYPYFHKAIREKHPEIKLINSAGPFPAGSEYDKGWESAKKWGSDYVDEHYYTSPEWMLANVHRYDGFDPQGPRVFLGEYASWGSTFWNALCEAAYMTGLENNAPTVGLACYAPLFAHTAYGGWRPDLIYFNNHASFGSAPYYVQQLFMHHQGDWKLKAETEAWPQAEKPEDKALTGNMEAAVRESVMELTELSVLNPKTGEKIEFPSFTVGGEETEHPIGHISWESFTLTAKLKKISGKSGLYLRFAMPEDKSFIFSWEIGGWENQDCLIRSEIRGRHTVLTQQDFAVDTGRVYDLRMEVEGRHVRTYVDGALQNEAEDTQPSIEPLYWSASEEEGDIILKAINVKNEPFTANICLEGLENTPLKGKAYTYASEDLEAENSYDAPEKLKPSENTFESKTGAFPYTFPAYSVTILRLQKV